MVTRRHFCKSGLLFVPTLFAIGRARGQSAFLGQITNGLLKNLRAYWACEGASTANLTDSTSNGFTGTRTNSVTQGTSGIIANGFTQVGFGNSGYSVNASIDSGAANTDPFSISFWWFGSGSGAGEAFLSKWDGTQAHDCYVCFHESGTTRIGWEAQDGSGHDTQVYFAGLPSSPDSWHHVVVGYDGAALWIQVNNSSRVTQAITGGQNGICRSSGVVFALGNYSSFNLGGQYKYDEIGFWSRSLSTSDVAMLFNNGHALAYSNFTG